MIETREYSSSEPSRNSHNDDILRNPLGRVKVKIHRKKFAICGCPRPWKTTQLSVYLTLSRTSVLLLCESRRTRNVQVLKAREMCQAEAFRRQRKGAIRNGNVYYAAERRKQVRRSGANVEVGRQVEDSQGGEGGKVAASERCDASAHDGQVDQTSKGFKGTDFNDGQMGTFSKQERPKARDRTETVVCNDAYCVLSEVKDLQVGCRFQLGRGDGGEQIAWEQECHRHIGEEVDETSRRSPGAVHRCPVVLDDAPRSTRWVRDHKDDEPYSDW